MHISGQNVRFSAFKLNFPKGKAQITIDNKKNEMLMFSDWSLIRTNVPPYRAALLDYEGKKVAEYPVRQELKGDQVTWVIDELDSVGAQG